ncbi:hypothetical protein [Paenibacillus sp. UASWS1643]|uniref:hypothetical protein n=1 Tax=Paenibacillus sp. UASWS1643 TaxID=2580422 RepID=UPI00123BFE84|nr:hypothetical protein [Paenibacillus sp. UASWS1643]KAA8753968.1 hypothetical protein FE296_12140 [Paenibacillus sp. UASWS1643]
MTTENNPHPHSFKLTWRGGFSYLIYLLRESNVTLREQEIQVQTVNKILGIFSLGTKHEQLTYSDIQKVSVGNSINWFQLLFAILFAAISAILLSTGSGVRWLALVASVVFFWLSFRSKYLTLTNRIGVTMRVISNSKVSIETLLKQLVQQLDNTRPGQIQVVREGKTRVAVIASGAAIIIAGSAILSMTMSENQQYISVVQNASFGQSKYKLKDIVEHPNYFSNVSWKNVSFEGSSDLDHYVMYEGTFSDSGVNVLARTVFQVFGNASFDVIEFSIDGEQFQPATTEWTLFAAHILDRLEGEATVIESKPKEDTTSQDVSNPIVEEEPPTVVTTDPISTVTSPEQTATTEVTMATDSATLSTFSQWSPPNADLNLPLVLDGESIDIMIGMDSPNGVKALAVSQSLQQGWQLPFNAPQSMSSPFDDFGDLREGFTLYVKEHDFDNDSVPEVVIVASDRLLETYVWVYSYNYIFSETDTSPLEPVWYGEGQSDVVLEGNKIFLPFGSQGLFDEYVFNNGSFIKN